MDSETIMQGTSRKQMSFSANQSFDLDAKGYRVYVKGSYSEQETDGSTGIHSQTAKRFTNDCFYTLSGLLVQPFRQGIYIRDGKKVVIR